MNFKKEMKVTLTMDISHEHYYRVYDFFQNKNKDFTQFKLEGNKFIFWINDLEQELLEEISTIISNGDEMKYSSIYDMLVPDDFDIPTCFVLELSIDEEINK